MTKIIAELVLFGGHMYMIYMYEVILPNEFLSLSK